MCVVDEGSLNFTNAQQVATACGTHVPRHVCVCVCVCVEAGRVEGTHLALVPSAAGACALAAMTASSRRRRSAATLPRSPRA